MRKKYIEPCIDIIFNEPHLLNFTSIQDHNYDDPTGTGSETTVEKGGDSDKDGSDAKVHPGGNDWDTLSNGWE